MIQINKGFKGLLAIVKQIRQCQDQLTRQDIYTLLDAVSKKAVGGCRLDRESIQEAIAHVEDILETCINMEQERVQAEEYCRRCRRRSPYCCDQCGLF